MFIGEGGVLLVLVLIWVLRRVAQSSEIFGLEEKWIISLSCESVIGVIINYFGGNGIFLWGKEITTLRGFV